MFQSSWSTRNALPSLFYYTLGNIFFVTNFLSGIIGGNPQLNLRKDCANITCPLGILCPDCSTVPTPLLHKFIECKRHQPSILTAIGLVDNSFSAHLDIWRKRSIPKITTLHQPRFQPRFQAESMLSLLLKNCVKTEISKYYYLRSRNMIEFWLNQQRAYLR